MNPNTQRNSYILLVLIVFFAISLACNINSLIGQADTDLQLEGELTNQESTDLQPYLGTYTSEIIDVKNPSEPYCPAKSNMFSFDGEVNYDIDGDTLIVKENNIVSSYLPYDPKIKAFCRTSPAELVDGVELAVMDCVSFQTISGVKTSNHRRYYDENGTPTLCFDQRTQMLNMPGNPPGSGSDSSLVGSCVVSPDLYLVEFTNINDEYSNESKTVCQGDFIIHNLSTENILLKYYQISDSGAQRHEKWHQTSIDPGVRLEWYFGSQKWTDGRSTLDTFSKLIVMHGTPECTKLIEDKNISAWEDSAVQLNDPCR